MIQGIAKLLVLLCELLKLPQGHGVDDPSSHQLDLLARRTGKVAGALDLDAFLGGADHFLGEVSDYDVPACKFAPPALRDGSGSPGSAPPPRGDYAPAVVPRGAEKSRLQLCVAT